MNFNLTKPCNECPFACPKKLYLPQERRQEIVDALRNDQTFPCHKTADYTDCTEYQLTGEESHCAGALIAMKNGNELQDNLMLRLAVLVNIFNASNLKDCDAVTNLDEFCS